VGVRIAWITAIAVCGLAILIGLLTVTVTGTGTGTGNSSQQLPGFAFSAGHDSSRQPPELTLHDSAAAMPGGAAQKDRSRWAKEGSPGDSHSGSGIPPRSGSQAEDTGPSTPVTIPRPKLPQAPGGDPAETPQAPSVTLPKPPQAAPVTQPEPAPAPTVISPDPPPAPPVTEPPKPPKP
jgi:hypothetical protein